jgi:5'-methylthioadenosine phosphorylase
MAGMIGILGGSGLYDLDGLVDVHETTLDTPFGAPSAPIVRGRIGSVELAFLARHGRGHTFSPSTVPYRANIWALKSLGCQWVVSVSAVGSLREDIAPGDVVLIDQFIDRTKGRPSTFFDHAPVAHISFGDPIAADLREVLMQAARSEGASVHDGGTYVCMEGPAFSTRAESELYRSWGAHVIGMTNLPEAKLAREAEMAYATLAMVTDYDCWHPAHGNVTVEAVIETLRNNVELARRIVRRAVPEVARLSTETDAHRALRYALITDPDAIGADRRAELDLLIRGVLG